MLRLCQIRMRLAGYKNSKVDQTCQEYRPPEAQRRSVQGVGKTDYHWYWWRGFGLVHISCVITIAHCVARFVRGEAWEVPSSVLLLEQLVEMRYSDKSPLGFEHSPESHTQAPSCSKVRDCICNKPERENGNEDWLFADTGSLSSGTGPP